MTKDEIEYKAYLFFKEKGLEYADNIDELIGYCRDFVYPFVSYFEEKIAELEKQVKDLKETNAILSESTAINQKDIEYKISVIEQRNKKIAGLKQQIEKMKRHCNCKHRDSEGYCEVKRTYLMDISYDGCDKWELED